ncbi:MinD/ParA family protein [Lutispora sp.]|uniref:MinD/ParA family protein n=1 Tax=Lutispora sp. TaxID=2828727 RepID=UPI002B21AE57|nr:MinD/ParA family protein [Lutispora sp.]MEA4962745.1 MinD/ParA family protein [Lutispora sp.]
MKDQAGKLRDIVEKLNSKGGLNSPFDESDISKDFIDKAKKNARVITITSGKGGVGKTNITINLAIKLSQLGLSVIIIDADLGLSNVDVALGIIPKYNLSDVINYRKGIYDILEEGPNGIRFISGGSGLQDLIKITNEQLAHLLVELGKLDEEADIIFIDTGAGISDQVLSFIYAAKEVIVVTTSEPTSITDAYALIKIISQKDKTKDLKLLLNRAENSREAANILDNLCDVCSRFLGLSVKKLGYVSNDANIPKAVKMQQPFVITFEGSEASIDISLIAEALIDIKTNKHDKGYGIRLFVNKLKWFFS